MEDKTSEKFCKGKEFVDCMFVNRNWDCNRESCPLSKNKTKDIKKHMERIMKETKLQGKKERNVEVKQAIDKVIIYKDFQGMSYKQVQEEIMKELLKELELER